MTVALKPRADGPNGFGGLGPRIRRGTGRVFPTKFVPLPGAGTPAELFCGRETHILIAR